MAPTWRNAVRTPLALIIFRKLLADVPGGAKMLHETLCRVQSQVGSRKSDVNGKKGDSDRLQWLIDLVEESGGYAPEGTHYRPLYEQFAGDDHDEPSPR